MISGYSEEFLSEFMEHLRRSHPSTRVSAKVVYNEYIANKDHVHMNSTKWLTLTDFVKFLGREGYCKVDQTEKGWHLVYQKKDIEQELEEERKSKRHKAEKVHNFAEQICTTFRAREREIEGNWNKHSTSEICHPFTVVNGSYEGALQRYLVLALHF